MAMAATVDVPGPGHYHARPIFRKENIGGKFGRESRDRRPISAGNP